MVDDAFAGGVALEVERLAHDAGRLEGPAVEPLRLVDRLVPFLLAVAGVNLPSAGLQVVDLEGELARHASRAPPDARPAAQEGHSRRIDPRTGRGFFPSRFMQAPSHTIAALTILNPAAIF